MLPIYDIKREWSDYLSAKKAHIKKLYKSKLDARIEHIESLQPQELEVYLERLCEAYFDDHLDIPITHPTIWSKVLQRWQQNRSSLDTKNLIWIYRSSTYPHVYNLLELEPHQILEKILILDPDHAEAQRLLFLEKLDTLDFALHELPRGLVLTKETCLESIEYCEKKIMENPDLRHIHTRFDLDFEYYKHLFYDWQTYQEQNIQEEFFQWLHTKQSSQSKETT